MRTAERVIGNLLNRCEQLASSSSVGDCSITTDTPKPELEAKLEDFFESLSLADAIFVTGKLEQRIKAARNVREDGPPEVDPVVPLFDDLAAGSAAPSSPRKTIAVAADSLSRLHFVQNFRQVEMMNVWGFIVSVLEVDDGAAISLDDLRTALNAYADGRFGGDISKACDHVRQSADRERVNKRTEEQGIELSQTEWAETRIKELFGKVSDPEGSNFRKIKFMLGIMQYFEEDKGGVIAYDDFQLGLRRMAEAEMNGDALQACKKIREGYLSLQRTGRLRKQSKSEYVRTHQRCLFRIDHTCLFSSIGRRTGHRTWTNGLQTRFLNAACCRLTGRGRGSMVGWVEARRGGGMGVCARLGV
jgi:hypothetical protein